MPVRLAITLTAIVLFAAPVHAQKERLDRKRPVLVRSQEPARPGVPGLQAALERTDPGAGSIVAVRDETLDSEEVRALKKGRPERHPRGDRRRGREAVCEKFHKEISAILTHDQKALIQTINDAYAKVVADVAEEYQPKIEAAKGMPMTSPPCKRAAKAVVAAFGKGSTES